MLQISLFLVAPIYSGLIHTMILILPITSGWISWPTLSYVLRGIQLVLLDVHTIRSVAFINNLIFILCIYASLSLLVLNNRLVWFYVSSDRNISPFMHGSFCD